MCYANNYLGRMTLCKSIAYKYEENEQVYNEEKFE